MRKRNRNANTADLRLVVNIPSLAVIEREDIHIKTRPGEQSGSIDERRIELKKGEVSSKKDKNGQHYELETGSAMRWNTFTPLSSS